jgi:DMSO/TMAO reductase YedYZ molybdopterin-dependent catalytic subunit
MKVNRREFLQAAALSTTPLLVGGAASATGVDMTETAQAQSGRNSGLPGLIIREKDPENLEYPFSTLETFITPNDRFYIRSHFPVPKLDTSAWRLKVEGAVDSPFELTYDDLLKMTLRTLVATLECAGNSRVFLTPTAAGAQWELGAISNAAWTGIPLAAILAKAGVKPNAVDVVLEGADSGLLKTEPKPPDAVHFARSLPLAKAMQPEVVLAYKMNGENLPVSHGYPLRAVVPGWYGVASVKWLSRIVVTDQPFHGHYQTIDYAYWDRRNGLPTRIPVTEMQVKSEISRPSMHEVIPAGKGYRILGAAWTSGAQISQVEVSTDGGQLWSSAKLLGRHVPYTWRLWEHEWRVPAQPGRYTIMARATDSQGRVQPMKRDPDRQNYMISHVLPIDVDVR